MEKSQNTAKIIFHIDFNAFFCSVAEIFNPALRNTAFAIGRENTRYGVISTCSYEARKYGIHSGMSLQEAFQLKPDLNIVSLPYSNYVDYHKKFIKLLNEYSHLVEVASIDEAYVDVSEYCKKVHPLVVAKEIQTRLLKDYHLPCSIGIAPNLFLAKMASDMKKPLGITVLRKREIPKLLYPLGVKEIYGIGKKTYPKLIESGINTIGDFVNLNNKDIILKVISESFYNEMINTLAGNSRNEINLERNAVNESISSMQTFDRRLVNEDEILYELRNITKDIYNRLINEKYHTKTINITLRDTTFKTITRSKTIDYTNDFYTIFDTVTDLFYDNYNGETLRLIGVGFSNLIKDNLIKNDDYNLFTIDEKVDKLSNIENMIDKLNKIYGVNSLYFGKDSKNDTTSSTSSCGVDAPEVMETLFTKVKS